MNGKSRVLLKKLSFFLIPALLSPLLFFGKELRCAFVILVMSLFWLTEVIPIGVTSLIPLFIFPFLDISKADDVSQCYFKDQIVLFMASLIMAMAVEETELHRRIALTLLNIVGAGKLRVLAGIMSTTAFISFFVSDTAATTLMLPIAIAILSSLNEAKAEEQKKEIPTEAGTNTVYPENGIVSHNNNQESRKDKEQKPKLDLAGMSAVDRGFCKAVVLAVSHASLIGGTGIITGTGTNLVFREQILDFYPDTEMVTYVQWMAFALPFIPIYLFAAGFIVAAVLMPGALIPKCRRGDKEEMANRRKGAGMKRKIKEAYDDLGRITFGQASVLIFLVLLLCAWCSRNPGFVDGWAKFLPQDGKLVKDSTVAVGVAVLMFFWPRDPFNDDQFRPILTWSSMKTKFSWSCMLLIGAGFAISEAVSESGLGKQIACAMNHYFDGVDSFWLQVIATSTVCFITEFASNVAAAGIFVPIMLSVAQGFQLNPLYLVLPVTISCSFAFMFPMATPGNAIVYDTKIVTLKEMMLVGFLLNISCIWITVLNFNTYSFWLLGLGEIPLANSTAHAHACGDNATTI